MNLLDHLTDAGWKAKLAGEFSQPYFKELERKLQEEYSLRKEIFPPQHMIFNAFNSTPIEQVKVVILGQDPYHDNGQAHGLCFSVPHGVGVPGSLKNIYTELANDIPGFITPSHGCLEKWANEGVLLLNATLTVEAHKANSHETFGWQTFTDNVIKVVSSECSGIVFILWGGFAQKKAKLINETKHHVIKAAHPSPLSSRHFFGCKCFSQVNAALINFGKTPINWPLS